MQKVLEELQNLPKEHGYSPWVLKGNTVVLLSGVNTEIVASKLKEKLDILSGIITEVFYPDWDFTTNELIDYYIVTDWNYETQDPLDRGLNIVTVLVFDDVDAINYTDDGKSFDYGIFYYIDEEEMDRVLKDFLVDFFMK